jgi:hypothetical protein
MRAASPWAGAFRWRGLRIGRLASPYNRLRNAPGANSRSLRQDVAEVPTALRIVLQGQEELD